MSEPRTMAEHDGVRMNPRDTAWLRRAIALAARARATGDPPFGALLVDPDGAVLREAVNGVVTRADIALHPELTLARWAARTLAPAVARGSTLYTSCQPCAMCAFAIERAGLGRVVFALGTDQLTALKSASVVSTAVARPSVAYNGPALFEEARMPVDGYYR